MIIQNGQGTHETSSYKRKPFKWQVDTLKLRGDYGRIKTQAWNNDHLREAKQPSDGKVIQLCYAAGLGHT